MTTDAGTDLIDLGVGHPEDAILPLSELREAALHRLSTGDAAPLQYGPDEGRDEYRERLADFLTRHYGVPVAPGDLVATWGASHALDLVLGRLAPRGATIFVEDPTYFYALDLFDDRGVRVVPVATDEGGLDVDALEDRLRVEVPTLLYTIPVFHNPTSVTLDAARRRRLVELAHEHGFWIVADEVYQLLAAPGAVPPPLRSSGAERVLSVGSFSKILGPGVRMGWVEAAPSHVETLADNAVLRSGGGASPFVAAIVESAIELGLQDRYLARIRDVYERRRETMISSLRRALPDDVGFTPPKGGYYAWLELPADVDTDALLPGALRAGVGYRPGSMFSARRNFANCMRLCFAFYDEARLDAGCERLGRVLRDRSRRLAAP